MPAETRRSRAQRSLHTAREIQLRGEISGTGARPEPLVGRFGVGHDHPGWRADVARQPGDHGLIGRAAPRLELRPRGEFDAGGERVVTAPAVLPVDGLIEHGLGGPPGRHIRIVQRAPLRLTQSGTVRRLRHIRAVPIPAVDQIADRVSERVGRRLALEVQASAAAVEDEPVQLSKRVLKEIAGDADSSRGHPGAQHPERRRIEGQHRAADVLVRLEGIFATVARLTDVREIFLSQTQINYFTKITLLILYQQLQ